MTEKSDGKQRGHLFKPGQSGNPAGKPKGTRHVALLALDAIGQEGAEEALRKVVDLAKGGDLRAAEILLRRVWPEPKGRPVALAIPRMASTGDLVAALAAITDAVAAGQITPDEGQAIAAVLEVQRRAIETADLAERVAALEAKERP